MRSIARSGDDLRRDFAATTEHVFHVEFGIADPSLTDYIVALLLQFVHMKSIFGMRNSEGHRLLQVCDMLVEADQRRDKKHKLAHRHIGDFTLFWTGYFPEMLKQLKSLERRDAPLDYRELGKRSYYIASTYDCDDSYVLRRLSDQFEVCSAGLHRVRQSFIRGQAREPNVRQHP